MLVVAQEETPTARVERRAALGGSAIDDCRRSIREELPLTKPLGLERGGDHEQPTADATDAPTLSIAKKRERRPPTVPMMPAEANSRRLRVEMGPMPPLSATKIHSRPVPTIMLIQTPV